MRNMILIAVLLLLLAPAKTASGQSKCDPAILYTALASLKSSGDNARDMTALMQVSDQIQEMNFVCNGMVIKGSQVASKILGPFTLPKGLYKATFVTSGSLELDIQQVGECSDGGLPALPTVGSIGIGSVLSGNATNGYDFTFTLNGDCKFYLSASASEDWQVTIVPLT